MLGIHVLGHLQVTWRGQVTPVSSKSAALLAYLSLEKQAYHREYLAELLWGHPQALSNLRVELTRLRQQGLDLFERRQVMLSAQPETDLERLRRELPDLSESALPGWLGALRGVPLSGLEDMGSTQFQSWVDQQRTQLTEQTEALLEAAAQRFARRSGGAGAVLHIRQRAEYLGLGVPETQVVSPPLASGSPFAAEVHTLHTVMARALVRPHLVLLSGQRGSQQRLLDETLGGTPWYAVHLRASSDRRLFQAALLQQLTPLPGAPPPHTPADDNDLMLHLARVLSASPVPIMIALHDLTRAEGWLTQHLRFLLDLRVPLMVVLTSERPAPLNELMPLLGQIDADLVHDLHLSPLGAQGVLRLWPELQGPAQRSAMPVTHPAPGDPLPVDPDAAYTAAAELAQQSEGWLRHIQALHDVPPTAAPAGTHRARRQPDRITQAVLADLHDLPAPVFGQLKALSMVLDHFDVAFATRLLDQDAAPLLALAVDRGLLVPSPDTEDLYLPDLSHRHDDAVTTLYFASETLRLALNSRLSSAERHQLRARLAALYLEEQPALAATYAGRAGLRDLERQARDRLPQPVTAALNAASAVPSSAPQLAGSGPRTEQRTHNGYRVALEGGCLDILRRGPPGPARELRVHFGDVPPGPWSLRLRLDLYEARWDLQSPLPHALALATGPEARHLYSPEPHLFQAGDWSGCCLGQLPLGQWVQLSGHSAGGPLVLSVRAQQIALTVAALGWKSAELLPDPVSS